MQNAKLKTNKLNNNDNICLSSDVTAKTVKVHQAIEIDNIEH